MSSFLRDPRLGLVWLAARLWVGWLWLDAGWEKLTDSAWVGGDAPAALDGFLANAASDRMTSGEFPQVSSWYAWLIDNVFLPGDTFMSYLIAFGEVAVGLGLIFGGFTMAAAFFGALMNLNFMLAGALGTGDNPLMFGLQLLILFAGPAVYVYGADRVAIPRLRAALRRREGRTPPRPRPLPH